MMHLHVCPEHTLMIGVTCSACGLECEPARRPPAEPHGWAWCERTGAVILACPLGVAEAEEAERADVGVPA